MRQGALLLVLFAGGLLAVGAAGVRADEAAAEEEASGSGTDGISLPAKAQPIPALLEAAAKATGQEILWDPRDRYVTENEIQGPIEIHGDRDRILDGLRALLSANDLLLVPLGPPDAGRWWIANARGGTSILKLRPRHVVITAQNAEALAAQDGLFVTTTLPVRHLQELGAARNALSRVVTGQNIGNVTEVPAARAFVVTDFAPNVVAIWRLLQEMDQPEAAQGVVADTRIEVLALEHADAVNVANILVPLFAAEAPPAPAPRARPQAAPTLPEPYAPRILANARLNQLVVRATEADFARIGAVVRALDRPTAAPEAPETVIEVIRLQHTRPSDLANTLTGLVQRGKDAWRAVGGGHAPVVVADSRSLVIEATPRALEKLRRVIAELDRPLDTEGEDE